MSNSTSKPQIAILMAVYEPNINWFVQQLDSLNRQTYPAIRLYVRDDCSPHTSLEDITACVKAHITAFPFEVLRNEHNLGSNETFGRLTEEAQGDYFAYCDQDDVWLPEKLETLLTDIKREQAQLVCSDMQTIDAEGKQIADRLAKSRRSRIAKSGNGLAAGLLTHNFVTGCTTLVPAETAKAALPFCPYLVYDQYLALFCAVRGVIYTDPQPLICSRFHGGNQTGPLAGVTDKASYCRIRIEQGIREFEWLREHFVCDEAFSAQIDRGLAWLYARRRWWCEKHGAVALWRYRDCGRTDTLFELATACMGKRLFLLIIRYIHKKGK